MALAQRRVAFPPGQFVELSIQKAPAGVGIALFCRIMMTIKKLAIAIFGRRSRRGTGVPIIPEFGARILLREGDKVVRRNPSGEVEVTTIMRGQERGA